MKFLYKYRRLISSVLAFTVSIMLFVTSIPASAASYTLTYSSTYYSPTSSWVKDTGNMVKGTTCYFNGSGSIALTNSKKSGFACLYRSQDYNGYLSFSIKLPQSWNTGLINKSIQAYVIVQALDGTVTALNLGSYSIKLKIDNDIVVEFVFTAESQAKFMDQIGWGQAYFLGVGIRNSAGVTGYFTLQGVTHEDVNPGSTDEDTAHWYSPLTGFFSDVIDWLGNFFKSSLTFVGDSLSNVINYATDSIKRDIGILADIVSGVWNYAKPILSPILDEVFIPTLNQILDSIVDISSTVFDKFSPLIADIINYFAPYFNQITDIITDNFLNLVSNLSPFINDFITAITPSFDSIVKNTASNISRILKECFIPDDTSAEYIEFVSMKDDVSNKFPVFNQLNTFVSVLFDPNGYTSGSSVQYSNLICTFDSFTSKNTNFSKPFYYNFSSGKSYYLTCNVSSPVNVDLVFKTPVGGYYKGYKLTNGTNKISFNFSSDVSSFSINFGGSTGITTVKDICLYSVDNSAGQEFTVNIYGKNVSVLNFDWYMPYKHYGDICVIAFCYLAFIWHTFKKLPTII